MHRTAPALTLAPLLAGLALAAAGCSSGDSGPAASSSTPEASAASSGAPASDSASPAPVSRYVDRVPEALRKAMFTQDAVPPSYADWISLTPGQTTVDGRREVHIDRRLPACDKEIATHYESDGHAAGFAATLFQAGGLIVARQLTVYHDEAEARAALKEVAASAPRCSRFAGKQVTASSYGDMTAAPDLKVPQHDQTVAGETSLSVGGPTGAAWWTVLTRQNNAVVLTRVVDPQAQVSADGTTADSAAFARAVAEQASTSAKALDSF